MKRNLGFHISKVSIKAYGIVLGLGAFFCVLPTLHAREPVRESKDCVNCVAQNTSPAVLPDKTTGSFQTIATEAALTDKKQACETEWQKFKSDFTSENSFKSFLKSIGPDEQYQADMRAVLKGDFSPIWKYDTNINPAAISRAQSLFQKINEALSRGDLAQAKALAQESAKASDQIITHLSSWDPRPRNLTDPFNKRTLTLNTNISSMIEENKQKNAALPFGKKELLIIETGLSHSTHHYLNTKDTDILYASRRLPEKGFILSPEYKAFLPYLIDYEKQEIAYEEKWLSEHKELQRRESKNIEYSKHQKRLADLKSNLKLDKKDLASADIQTRNLAKAYMLEILAITQYMHGGIDPQLEEAIIGSAQEGSKSASPSVIMIQDIHNQNDKEMTSALPMSCLEELGYGSVVVALEGYPKGSNLDRETLWKNAGSISEYPEDIPPELLEKIKKSDPRLHAALLSRSVQRNPARVDLLTSVFGVQIARPELKVRYTGIE